MGQTRPPIYLCGRLKVECLGGEEERLDRFWLKETEREVFSDEVKEKCKYMTKGRVMRREKLSR